MPSKAPTVTTTATREKTRRGPADDTQGCVARFTKITE